MKTQPRTTLIGGIARLGDPMPNHQPIEAAMPMQKPAKPAKKKAAKDEDYSTDYKPPVPPAAVALVPVAQVVSALSITNDPLPARRVAPLYKYDSDFNQLQMGQALRDVTANISKLSNALRSYIRRTKKVAHVLSCPRFTDAQGVEDAGFGRVWMVAGASKMPSRRKAA